MEPPPFPSDTPLPEPACEFVFPLPPLLPPRVGPSPEDEEQAKKEVQAMDAKSPLRKRARGDSKYIQ